MLSLIEKILFIVAVIVSLYLAYGTFGKMFKVVQRGQGQLDLDKLVGYALRYAVGATVKRLGWALETLRAPECDIAPLRAFPVRAWAQLDPTGPPGGTPVAGWKLRNNLRSEVDDAHC